MDAAPVRLRELTTLRLGGPARRFVHARTEQELLHAVRSADAAGEPVLVVGGGSNLVVADAGFDGVVVQVATTGITDDAPQGLAPGDPACGGTLVKVAAGENWDDFVAHAVRRGWVGIEALSGIPGSVGAVPVQNVGAYGQEVSQTIAAVRTWDRIDDVQRTFSAAECQFGYRHSRFKADPERYLVLEVTFQFESGLRSAPVAYGELARAVGVEIGERAPSTVVRQTVRELRAGKGMVLDVADHDTWSAGSFFTNPFLTAGQAIDLPEEAPRFPQADGRLKTSAAWLIDHAGYPKGYGNDRVSLSTKHTLALTNRGDATTEDLLALAREIQDGVEQVYGVRLVNEPVLVNCHL